MHRHTPMVPLLAATLSITGIAAHASAADRLDPSTLTKFIDPLPIPGVMPHFSTWGGGKLYVIGMAQVQQQLHSELPPTTVWGYGPLNNQGGYDATYPGRTIEATRDKKIFVRWENALPTTHLLPIDTTIEGAGEGEPEVRVVAHLHGGDTASAFDGLPTQWFTQGFAETGPGFVDEVYQYDNKQNTATLWYHDHAMGVTRLNVYAGLAGFYLIRSSQESDLHLPSGQYEIPIAIQDRSFNTDGSLFYPDEAIAGVQPSVVPEVFGDTAVVNGKVWPRLVVQPRKYRMRLLNGCNSRFLNIRLFEYNEQTGQADPSKPGPGFKQIGTDGGLLEHPVTIPGRLLMGPGERFDVVLDFHGKQGKTYLLHNNAKTPFMGLDQATNEVPLPEIMLIKVAGGNVSDNSSVPNNLTSISFMSPSSAAQIRHHTLEEGVDQYGRLMLLLNGKAFTDAADTFPVKGTREVWDFINLTPDVHPIHMHLVQYQVVARHAFDTDAYAADLAAFRGGAGPQPVFADYLVGGAIPPDANEKGWKDTVRVNPGQLTRIIAKFNRSGEYVWHCHILEHEEYDMMRPYTVVP